MHAVCVCVLLCLQCVCVGGGGGEVGVVFFYFWLFIARIISLFFLVVDWLGRLGYGAESRRKVASSRPGLRHATTGKVSLSAQ